MASNDLKWPILTLKMPKLTFLTLKNGFPLKTWNVSKTTLYVKLNNKQHAKGAYESAIRSSQTGNALNVGGSTLATTYLEYSQFLLDSGAKTENYSKIFENLNKAYQVSSANDDDLHGKIFKLNIELENGGETVGEKNILKKIKWFKAQFR